VEEIWGGLGGEETAFYNSKKIQLIENSEGIR
jgi:hypothetical protein